MERYKCSFCGKFFESGTGKILVKTSGTMVYLCSMKCEKNMLRLGRSPKKVRWAVRAEKK